MNFKLSWKGIVVAILSFVSLFFTKKSRILKYVLAVVSMVIICMIAMFALSGLKVWFVVFPLIVMVLNIIVCLVIQAPRKWIIASSISIFTISIVWIGKILIGNAKAKKEVITIDENGNRSSQLV